jgi:hypothetical protein
LDSGKRNFIAVGIKGANDGIARANGGVTTGGGSSPSEAVLDRAGQAFKVGVRKCRIIEQFVLN